MSDARSSRLMNATAAAKALALVAGTLGPLCSPANALQSPAEHCRPASKIEYDSAKRDFLLRNRFGAYVKTGRIWHRHYWYCQL